MNAVAKVENLPAAQPEGATLLSVISRAASDPNTDIDKMERLMAMYERMESRKAEAEFASALAEMQDALPAIGERGKALVNGQVRYTFALWEDINTAIKPVLKQFGFALSFRTDFTDGIKVTGVLTHRGGHKIETSIILPSDTSGSKNAVQAVASSVSYGKRYTAGALLNLTSHGEDDDAYAAAVETITEDQVITIREWLESTGSNPVAFCKAFKVNSIPELPAKEFNRAMGMLKAKLKGKQ